MFSCSHTGGSTASPECFRWAGSVAEPHFIRYLRGHSKDSNHPRAPTLPVLSVKELLWAELDGAMRKLVGRPGVQASAGIRHRPFCVGREAKLEYVPHKVRLSFSRTGRLIIPITGDRYK